MKHISKITLTIGLLFLIAISYAQPLQTGLHYKIKSDKILYKTDNGVTFTEKTLCGNKLKANVTQDSTILKLDFLAIKPSTDPCIGMIGKINSSDPLNDSTYYYLKIDKRTSMATPTQYITLSYATWEVGLTTIPFKYRFGNKNDTIPNDASSSVNAGVYVGRKWGATRFYEDKTRNHNSWAFTFAGFISPTVIAISLENTKKKVATSSNEFGISYGVAFLASYREINFGLLTGLDTPLSGNSKYWIYANRPWIGFGIGYKLGILDNK